MTLYIRKLILVDENDNVIYGVEKTTATKGLTKALSIVRDKEGLATLREQLKKNVRELDKEFKEYFNMGGNFEKEKKILP